VHVIYGTGGRLDWDRVLFLLSEHWQRALDGTALGSCALSVCLSRSFGVRASCALE
jgi:hypothetical protein